MSMFATTYEPDGPNRIDGVETIVSGRNDDRTGKATVRVNAVHTAKNVGEYGFVSECDSDT